MKPVANAFLLSALLTVVLAGTAVAQWEPTNYFTLQPWLGSSAHDVDCWHRTDGTFETLTLFLYGPVNPTFGAADEERPVEHIGSFECRVEFTEGVTVLGWNLPAGAINTGTNEALSVHYGVPLPVLAEPVGLCTVNVYIGEPVSFDLLEPVTGPCYLHYNIESFVKPPIVSRVPGSPNYTDADDTSHLPLVAGDSAGDTADLKFALHREEEVANDEQTWDSLKALYR